MLANEPQWYMPGSVLNALWGSVMPKLAATVWKGDLQWPPEGAVKEEIHEEGSGNGALLVRYEIVGKAREAFWDALARIAFGSAEKYRDLAGELVKGELENGARLSASQRAAHVVLEYFDPYSDATARVPLRVITARAYDFVLSRDGLDMFTPENPFKGDDEHGRIKVLQMYRFRETGKPPIALPGEPCTFDADHGVLISIPQLSAPTGSFQIHEDWSKALADKVGWWLAGSSYRGMMAALPRVIATKWYDELVGKTYTNGTEVGPTSKLFKEDLKKLLEERMETPLPATMVVEVVDGHAPSDLAGRSGWHAHDVMITDAGFHVPDPGLPPNKDQILDAIERGTAGNPVFTDSDTDE